MTKVQIKPTKIRDMDELIATMRQEDVDEVQTMARMTPDQVVPLSVLVSEASFAMRLRAGPLLCICGAAITHSPKGTASIWELGTTAIDRFPKHFVRNCRRAMRLVVDAIPAADTFYNFIPAGNARSRRWLESLGARFGDPTLTPSGAAILPFTIHRKDVPHV